MIELKNFAKYALTGVALMAPIGASAAVIEYGDSAYSSNGSQGSVATSLNSVNPREGQITFTWEESPFSAYQNFSVSNDFALYFTNYQTDRDPNARSGFTLDALDSNGMVTMRYTDDTSFCDGAELSEVAGTCNLITGIAGDANSNEPDPYLTSALFNLNSGEYRLGLYESEYPYEGSAEFTISAVPVPAAGGLLLLALGGLGVARKRRKAA